MAERAVGRSCPGCGTLTAVGGKLSEKEWQAQCGTCKAQVIAQNPEYAEPPVDKEKEDLKQQVADLTQQLASKTASPPQPSAPQP